MTIEWFGPYFEDDYLKFGWGFFLGFTYKVHTYTTIG